MDVNTLLWWGVVLIGALLIFEAVRALFTGHTYGYYRSHVYDRRENFGSYFLWVAGRAILGTLAITIALIQ
jgi:hypothetical protein